MTPIQLAKETWILGCRYPPQDQEEMKAQEVLSLSSSPTTTETPLESSIAARSVLQNDVSIYANASIEASSKFQRLHNLIWFTYREGGCNFFEIIETKDQKQAKLLNKSDPAKGVSNSLEAAHFDRLEIGTIKPANPDSEKCVSSTEVSSSQSSVSPFCHHIETPGIDDKMTPAPAQPLWKFLRSSLSGDTGWGCTLRTSQMLFANLMLEHFGTILLPQETQKNFLLTKVISWFLDNQTACFSLFCLLQNSTEKRAGQWFGPKEACMLFHKIITRLLVAGTLRASPSSIQSRESRDETCIWASHPLCTMICPEATIPRVEVMQKHSTEAVVLLVPIRLGMDKIEQVYVEGLIDCFRNKWFRGAVGGKNGSSLYFFGTQSHSSCANSSLTSSTSLPASESLNLAHPSAAAAAASSLSSVSCAAIVGNLDPKPPLNCESSKQSRNKEMFSDEDLPLLSVYSSSSSITVDDCKKGHLLLYLDPHVVQQAVVDEADLSNPTVLETFKYKGPYFGISMEEVDPSMILAFYCDKVSERTEFLNWLHYHNQLFGSRSTLYSS